MKKGKSTSDDLRKEYTRSDFDKLERGKYYNRVIAHSNVVVIDPNVTTIFPNSVAVNTALRSLVDVAEKAAGIRRHSVNRRRQRNGVKK